METIHLTLLNIKCSGCAEAVTSALAQVPGITKSRVSVPESRVEISAEGNVDIQQIEEVLRKAGYPIAG